MGENFKLGAGYNFTDFSDDLTDLSYDNRGWFLNLTGVLLTTPLRREAIVLINDPRVRKDRTNTQGDG